MQNSGAVVREALDKGFQAAKDWQPRKTGGIDWTKRLRYNETVLARIGVEESRHEATWLCATSFTSETNYKRAKSTLA